MFERGPRTEALDGELGPTDNTVLANVQ